MVREESDAFMIKDPWEDICREAGLGEPFPYVSNPIPKELIARYAPRHEPRLVIPIYSMESMETRFPFLFSHHLTPLRVDNGTAVLTRAELFQTLQPIRSKTEFLNHIDAHDSYVYLSDVQTEAKFLALALNCNVLHTAFGLDRKSHLSLGLFGKMNLPERDVYISNPEKNSNLVPVHLSNVQFDLDFSVEDKDTVYLIEAKRGKPKAKSFCILQLFYPYALMHELRKRGRKEKRDKKIRCFFVNIEAKEDYLITYEFHEYSFAAPLVVNSARYERGVVIQLQIGEYENARLEQTINPS